MINLSKYYINVFVESTKIVPYRDIYHLCHIDQPLSYRPSASTSPTCPVHPRALRADKLWCHALPTTLQFTNVNHASSFLQMMLLISLGRQRTDERLCLNIAPCRSRAKSRPCSRWRAGVLADIAVPMQAGELLLCHGATLHRWAHTTCAPSLSLQTFVSSHLFD